MEAAEEREDLVADQAALRAGVRAVFAERQAFGAAVRLGLRAPEHQEWPDDAVLSPGLDALRRAARGEAVEDGLDLVGGGVAGRAEAVPGEGVAQVAERLFGGACGRGRFDDLCSQLLAAEARVLLRLGAPELVVHVERVDSVAERAQHMPEAGRVRAAGDEREHLAAGRDQLVAADVLLDLCAEEVRVDGIHADSVAGERHAFVTVP